MEHYLTKSQLIIAAIWAVMLSASVSVAKVSPDLSIITGGGNGQLETNDGIWTFGAAIPQHPGNWVVLLNGVIPIGGQGIGSKLEVANGGNLYHFGVAQKWWIWQDGRWVSSEPPPPAPGDMSPDGSIIADGIGRLVTADGTWTFGAATPQYPGNWKIWLNGLQAQGGVAKELEVLNGGKLYHLGADSRWYFWQGGAWAVTTNPHSGGGGGGGGGGGDPGAAITGDSFIPNTCNNSAAARVGNGVFRLAQGCAGLSGPVVFPQGYGKYKLDFSLKAQLHNGAPPPILRVWIDGIAVKDFAVNSTNHANYGFDFWARTNNHSVTMQFQNTSFLIDGNWYWDQTIDVETLTVTAYPDPPSPVAVQITPGTAPDLTSDNTLYKLTADTSVLISIWGTNTILDCQGHSVLGVFALGHNETIKNCHVNSITIYGNHTTAQDNRIDLQLGTGASPTSGHLITGNTLNTAGTGAVIDDPIFLQNISDVIVSNNTIYFSFDIEIEGMGYWHLVTFSGNVFPSPSGAFIGGWYDDNRSQGFQPINVSIINNSFKKSVGCWSWSTIACGGTDAQDQIRANSGWVGDLGMKFSGNKVIP